MSIYAQTGDLSVRISTPTIDRYITSKVSGLSFHKVASGGHVDAQMQVNAPRSAFPDLGPDCKIWIYNRLGRTVWEGFANNPGSTFAEVGESFDLSALGISTLLTDMAQPVLYRDTSYDSWAPTGSATPSANAQVTTLPDGSDVALAGQPCMLLGFTPGQPLGNNAGKSTMGYAASLAPGQLFGAVFLRHDAGQNATDYKMQIYMGVGNTFYNASLSGTSASTTGVLGTDYTVGDSLVVALTHTGAATNVSTTVDTLWLSWQVLGILGSLRNADGIEQAPPRVTYLLASEVVADASYRFLGTQVDPNRVSIAATTYQIDQLAYPSPTRMQAILDDLAVWEPGMTYEVTPSDGSGRYGFAYRPWDDGRGPRYEISIRDRRTGFTQPGSDADLCNRVAVSWTDITGKAQTTVVTSTVPALGTRVRDADPVTLPAGRGSAANATRLGQSVLAATSTPPSAATATINRRIRDLCSGRMVDPWDIEPGYLVHVRETGQDLRLTEMSYDHDDRSATLTLGDPVYDTDQIVAALAKGRQLIPLNSGGTYTP